MEGEFQEAVKIIFKFKRLLKEIIEASMNEPSVYLARIYPIYKEFVDLVDAMKPYTIEEVNQFISNILAKYSKQPFFPVLGGLFVTALLNRLFQTEKEIHLNLEDFCNIVVDNALEEAPDVADMIIEDVPGGNPANQEQMSEDLAETFNKNEVGYSLDFLGYRLPERKTLKLIGPGVGDFCGALMHKKSILIITGEHGKHLGLNKDPEAIIIK
jgi:hypothetical protein